MKAFWLFTALAITSFSCPSLAEDALPADHPPVGATDSQGRATNPHALMDAPENHAREDETLPRGTIRIRVRNEKGDPVAAQSVILGVLENTVAKGERREQFTKLTDAAGDVVFEAQRVASGIAYRVRTFRDGAVFFAPPFTLSETRGTNVLVHVFPVTRKIDDAQVAFEAVLFSELRDDRIQFDEVFTVHNLGATAWLAEDVFLALPQNATGFTAQSSMSDQAITQVAGRGASLRGTFAPGEHHLSFRWQLPLRNESEINFTVGLPPHVAIMRVGTAAVPGLSLHVQDLPDPRPTTLQDGARAIMTERLLKPKEKPVPQWVVRIAGLPAAGLGRLAGNVTYELAAGVAALAIALAVLSWSLFTRTRSDGTVEREALLHAISDLEAAHARGEVGPQSYEHLRRDLIDQLAARLLFERPPTAV
jgi:hypothetical protein